ncbi:hypothetical protein PFHG_01489 [Plasmodium falciparum HB3]|uniref:Uncharacterized protein n=2 Tax=Plasmodium falciparum TaxID=5833 RepID=A0A0L7M062_PLAF4|nr:hypothetical protein PFHG_01489 [Plasmodium falciparum HB3]KOB86274.1 hypothetical protein PFDG_01799 [Plasmodium falciparum Dd2]
MMYRILLSYRLVCLTKYLILIFIYVFINVPKPLKYMSTFGFSIIYFCRLIFILSSTFFNISFIINITTLNITIRVIKTVSGY